MSARARWASLVLAGATLSALALGLAAAPASAHPLGNATVNHYDGLTFAPDSVVDAAVEDTAEIPTLQRKSRIDTDRDGAVSAQEASAYAVRQCAAMADALDLTVDGTRVPFAATRSSYAERPGAIRLVAGRLECDLVATVALDRAATVAFASRWDADGVGWHEITGVGRGVTLHDSPFPARSISDALRAYPNDLLSSPLDVTRGEVSTSPGGGASTYAAVPDVPGAGLAVRVLDGVTKSFESRVGADHLTAGVIALTVFLAMLLGAGHACLPGHGKTIMAAYLVGRRGRLRDVVAVGATVTATHTMSVLVLGLGVSASATFAPTAAVRVLAIVSGLIVTGVGAGLLGAALLRRRRSHTHVHEPARTVHLPALALAGTTTGAGSRGGVAPASPHQHAHDHDHDHAHDHHHDHHHAHDHGHPHVHDGPMQDPEGVAPHRHGPFGTHTHEPRPVGRGGLVGLGVAGGLVPSPSALLVLLAAFALGRGWLGVVLVLAYGVGMAGTLSAAGLLLVRLRDRLARAAVGDRFSWAARVVAVLPFVTAGLVLVVGVVLTARALGGTL